MNKKKIDFQLIFWGKKEKYIYTSKVHHERVSLFILVPQWDVM